MPAARISSFFALCDGDTRSPLASAQDHKRAFDQRPGPEHRRHGRLFADAVRDGRDPCAQIMEEMILPTLRGMKARGTPFQAACSMPA